MSSIIDKIEKATEIGDLASDIYASAAGNYIRNKLPSSDSTARPGFKGERHTILKLPNGKMGIANYAGPGTHIIERLQRGDPPRTYTDKVSRIHDIKYALSTYENTQKEQLRDIRLADDEMVKSLYKAREKNKDNLYNIMIGMRLIQGKKMLEDVGVIKKNTFSGKLGMYNNRDKAILITSLSKANK